MSSSIRKITGVIAATAGICLAAVGIGGISSAQAGTCTTNSSGTTFCNTTVVSHSLSNANTTVLSVASSDVSGKVNLRFQTATGYSTSAGCVKATSMSQVRAGTKCVIFTKYGYHFANSGINRSGTRVYFNDYIGSKYSPVGSKFYYDSVHKTWRKQNCGNYVRFSSMPTLKVASVALVRTFSSIKVSVKVSVTATESVRSTASCTTAGASASGTATGTGSATAWATASASASTYTSAKSSAASKITASVQTSALAKAYAYATVKMTASATAMCSSTTVTPPTPTPTTTTPAPTCLSVYGPGYSGNYPTCTKDGTTTPTPPPTAPGPNPTDTNPVSSQCYDPNTGQPVPAGTPGAWCS